MSITDIREYVRALAVIFTVLALLAWFLQDVYDGWRVWIAPCVVCSQVWAAAYMVILCLPGAQR